MDSSSFGVVDEYNRNEEKDDNSFFLDWKELDLENGDVNATFWDVDIDGVNEFTLYGYGGANKERYTTKYFDMKPSMLMGSVIVLVFTFDNYSQRSVVIEKI